MKPRIIISGGGTGGHIFPAISIANAIKELQPEAEILFVGAEGRMEMQRVPDAGYKIIGLPVAGFDRKNLLKNIPVLYKLAKSLWMTRKILKDFKPQVAVGVGGFASGPTLKAASKMGIPILIQEQNSFAGVTNKLLAKSADKICVAYEGMDNFFPADRIILTGNPVRQNLLTHQSNHDEAVQNFGFDKTKKIILIVGGSLGARTINDTMKAAIDMVMQNKDIQFIWQTGKIYIEEVKQFIKEKTGDEVTDHHVASIPNLFITEFIKNMDDAYAAADLVISRAGAGSISEFCLLRKPVILVPSPNVAEDHQTKNALALVSRDAALYVKDSEAIHNLIPVALDTVRDDKKLKSLSENIATLALPDSANIIAKEVLKLIKE
ncbi:MAG: undecaprenyldiphospho-muramoylpentapeptide beta-N-acetylglucosaminyltransferase [Bacteroidaceae bacterium]|nr:undecaprenyldiphospho-muramoylpentapeptide beta-N-acetylglucosaminyltransferase [Bacteroidaceae bacterium]